MNYLMEPCEILCKAAWIISRGDKQKLLMEQSVRSWRPADEEVPVMNFEKIKEIMVDTLSCDEEKIRPEARIAEDLSIDSLDAVELVMALEEEFDIKIPDEELGKMKTVQDIADCVARYQA